MSQEIEQTVSAILENAGVIYSAINRGVKVDAFGEKTGHSMDAWECEFTNAKRPNDTQKFDYFTGMGHRAPATRDQKIRATHGFQGLTENDKKGLTSYGRRYLAEVEKMRKPVTPHAAGVLYSLILDSSAVEQSFSNWCSEYGYDDDSRKALATYEACQANADKLARIFDHATREAIREALQDY